VVKGAETSGRTVNYWDLVNEPPGQNPADEYFDGDDSSALTVSDIEGWLLHTYDDVKAADPNAEVVCPSLESYEDYPGELPASAQLVDFSTFLAFAAAHNMQCAAFSWHEINTSGRPTDFNDQPQDLMAHVSRFRSLLATFPMFAHAKIFINEYGAFTPAGGSQTYQSTPGWTVGNIAALEGSGVDEANRSCVPDAGCADQADGLLVPSSPATLSSQLGVSNTPETVSPSAVYWPYLFYAQMNGVTVPVSSSAEQVSGFAVVNATTRTLRVLLGRHEDMTGANENGESISMTVAVPWSTPTVAVAEQAYPDYGGPVGQPPTTSVTVSVMNGMATFTIPAIGPEDAYGITVTPTS